VRQAGSVAVAHDYFTSLGGAERVAAVLASLFPGAGLYTAAHDRRRVPLEAIGGRPWRTSFVQAPASRAGIRPLFPLLPRAFASLDIGSRDLVISSTSGFAHHVRAPEGALHVAYCHTPPRFLWRQDEYFHGRPALRRALAPLLPVMRRKDIEAARSVDRYVTVSKHIARQVRDLYGREAGVIHPPVDCSRFAPSGERSGRFLVVSRLVPPKRIGLAIEAARLTGTALDIIGAGPDEARLRSLAGPSVSFLGFLPDRDVADAMARADAVVVPGREDFGLVTAEAQAAGTPPIAFEDSGAADVIEDGVTGFLFREQTAAAVAGAMLRARERRLDVVDLVASARRFDRLVFKARFLEFVDSALGERAAPAMALSGAVV
jgi:glycosyltransferase involved in cell wall biosynthesis